MFSVGLDSAPLLNRLLVVQIFFSYCFDLLTYISKIVPFNWGYYEVGIDIVLRGKLFSSKKFWELWRYMVTHVLK